MNKVRIDKYLWAIRFYKTRSQAGNAIKSGKVKLNGNSVKSAAMVEVGNIYTIKKARITYTIKVLELINKRMSAKLVADKYEDLTPEEEKKSDFVPSAFYQINSKRKRGTGRPTKKERRNLDELNDGLEEL